MPPKRADASEPDPGNSSERFRSVSATGEQDADLPPFFNTTFAIYRASPLYLGQNGLKEGRLEELSRRLRDTLVGDVVRGIQISLEATDTPWGQVGPLKAINFRRFQAKDVIGEASDEDDDDDLADKEGLWLEVRHENAAYHALMLPGYSKSQRAPHEGGTWSMLPGDSYIQGETDDTHFLHLPLVLMRMPLPLQRVIAEWLASTFDCRISKLSIGTRTITAVWEGWLRSGRIPRGTSNITITLGFNAPLPPDTRERDTDAVPPGLKTLDISVAPRDLRRFMRYGATIAADPQVPSSPWALDQRERRKLAGGSSDDGWGWLRAPSARREQPFTEALAAYLEHHLALRLFHPGVRVVQVACEGFVLGQTRLKVVRRGEGGEELSRAAWEFVRQLGDRVKGDEVPTVFGT